MTSAQIAELRKRMATNRQPVERDPWGKYDHPRGWNDALAWVETQIRDITGERDAAAQ
ncbi:hypothetical protein [Bradyrhizobium sp. SZCCHNR1020]|uniref:hypothetical protein n=1 Tax=Bradyrhizobium sp. SZCCHNR1020 TaxID=3057343 RepID=UPI00291614D3|nr:hypothetical protein [Bradyrhizobium sp. SZCCHNR1020]